jgi:hypothetical protein
VLLCLLLTIALFGAVVTVRSWKGGVSEIQAPSSISARSDPAERSSAVTPLRVPNPAAQRPGPPDPLAQKTAVTAAESAAKAAADLAASVAPSN